MHDVFVTGTDTGVGKTVVVAAICAVTKARPLKAIQTGEDDDLAFVEAVTNEPAPPPPYRFAEPLAPKVAAARAGTTIDLQRIVDAYETLHKEHTVVVEGAGGLLVEITDGFTMADLARALALPLVIVARPGLGTLNHTALTIEAARARHLEIEGIVLCGWPDHPDLATRTNPAQLARHAPLLGVIPHLAGLDTSKREAQGLERIAPESLAPRLGGTFDAEAFLNAL